LMNRPDIEALEKQRASLCKKYPQLVSSLLSKDMKDLIAYIKYLEIDSGVAALRAADSGAMAALLKAERKIAKQKEDIQFYKAAKGMRQRD